MCMSVICLGSDVIRKYQISCKEHNTFCSLKVRVLNFDLSAVYFCDPILYASATLLTYKNACQATHLQTYRVPLLHIC